MKAYKENSIKLSVVFREIMEKYNMTGEQVAKLCGASFGVANQLLHDKPTSEKFISNLIAKLAMQDEKLIRRLVFAYLKAKFDRVDSSVLKKAGIVE
jgi:hypothetical protein